MDEIYKRSVGINGTINERRRIDWLGIGRTDGQIYEGIDS